jgi:hypothetical protein
MESLIMSFHALEMSVDVLLLKSDPPKMGEFAKKIDVSFVKLDQRRRAGRLIKDQLKVLSCLKYLQLKEHTIRGVLEFDLSPAERREAILALFRVMYRDVNAPREVGVTLSVPKAIVSLLSRGDLESVEDAVVEGREFHRVRRVERYPVVAPTYNKVSNDYVPTVPDDRKWSVVLGGGDVVFDDKVEAVTGSSFSSGYLLNEKLRVAREKTELDHLSESEARMQFGVKPFRSNWHWPPRFGVSAARRAVWSKKIDEYKGSSVQHRRTHSLVINNAYDLCQQSMRTNSKLHELMAVNADLYEVSNHFVPPVAPGLKLGDFFPPGTYFNLLGKVFLKIELYGEYVLSLFPCAKDVMIARYLLNRITDSFYMKRGLKQLIGSIVNCVGKAVSKLFLARGKSVFDFMFRDSSYAFVEAVDVDFFSGGVTRYVSIKKLEGVKSPDLTYSGMLSECWLIEQEHIRSNSIEVSKLQGMAIGELVQDIDWTIVSRELPFLVKMVSMMTILVQAESWSTMVAAITLALPNFDETICGAAVYFAKLIEMMEPKFRTFLSGVVSRYQGSGLSTFKGPECSVNDPVAMGAVKEAMLAPDASSFLNSDLGGAIWELFASFSVMGVFAVSGIGGSVHHVRQKVREFSYLLRNDGRDDPVESFIGKLTRLVTICADRCSAAIKAQDWRLLFKDDMTFAKWAFLLDTLREDECVRFDPARPDMERLFRVKKSTGLLPVQLYRPLDLHDRVTMLRDTVSHAGGLRLRYAANPQIISLIRSKEADAQGAIRTLEAMEANASYRIPPWGVFVYGQPGVGKTNLISRFHAALASHLGFSGDSATMYRPDPKSNFEDGFNQSQWGCLCDDIDTSIGPDAANVRNHADLINKLVNSAPHCMEQAAVEEKGKMWANFLSLYYLTNNRLGNLKQRVMEPYQFWRRLRLYITMRIRPEFDDGNGGIHKVNAFNADGLLKNDIWFFDVQSYDPKYGDANNKYDVLPYGPPVTFNTEADLFRSLLLHYDTHHLRERSIYNSRKLEEQGDAPKCEQCRRVLSAHSSGRFCEGDVYVLQGWLAGAPDSDIEVLMWYLFIYYALLTFYSQIRHKLVAGWNALPNTMRLTMTIWFYQRFIFFFGAGNYLFAANIDTIRWRYHMYAAMEWKDWKEYCSRYVPSRKVLVTLGLIGLAVPIVRRYMESSIPQGASVPNPTGLPRRVDVWQNVDRKMFDRPYMVREKPTYTVHEMMSVLQRRMVRVTGPNGTMFGVMGAGGVLIFPKHAVVGSKPRGVSISDSDITLEIEAFGVNHVVKLIPRLTTLCLNRDIVITYVPEVTVFKDKWDLLSEIPPTCLATSGERADEAWLVLPDSIRKYDGFLMPTNRYDTPSVELVGAWSGRVTTNDGDCGAPVVARFGDRFYWVGAHGVLRQSTTVTGVVSVAIAESYARREMTIGIDKIKKFNPSSMEVVFDPKVVDPEAECLTFQGLPTKSSLNVSLCFKPHLPIVPIGTYVGKVKFGASLKTKIVTTGFDHPTLRRLLSEFLKDDEFQPPVYRGSMKEVVDDDAVILRWVDPHTRSLEQSRNKGGDSVFWDLAVLDYLKDLENLQGATGIVPLSDYSTIIGIEGTTCGSVDLQTSAGAPFYRKKNVCVAIDRSVDPPVVEFVAELRDGIDRILKVVDDGDVYSPVAVHCLKDECVTRSKNLKSKIRVFNIMPFAFNFLLKKYISPIVAFFRLHPLHFEHAIGLNIAGVKDATKLDSYLRQYPNCLASDVSDFDISASTRELLYSSLVVQKMAHTIGYTSAEAKRLWGLLMSAIHVTHFNKGDFWFSNYGLASGYWITLFLNCIRNSLQSRYAYYALGGGIGLPPFRSIVNLVVLGDDNIGCVRPGFEWYNQVSVAASLAAIGAVRTSSIKGADLVPYESIENATFLKRVFRSIDNVVVCPIEKKTLLRMLCFRRKTHLSDHDHLCVILTTVMSEAWMWDREFFEEVKVMCHELAITHALSGRNLVLSEFNDYLEKYKSGQLVTWNNVMSQEEGFFV